MEEATFGAGCFWCVEAVFQRVNGVQSVTSGYAGGHVKNPSYREICTGKTGHAEVARIVFDPNLISFEELLEIFWKTHDPTTLNRQGADVGTQYRSVIFYHDENQKSTADKYKVILDQAGIYENPIITEISPLPDFYEAEEDHQNYYNNNSSQPYCTFVVAPKIDKLTSLFREKLKT